MAPKGKGAAGAGKQSALTSTFGPVFKKIELKDLASHKDNSFTVLGSYWGDQCATDDKATPYPARVVETNERHKFAGVSKLQPAVRFVLTGSAAQLVDATPLWMELEEYAKRRTEYVDAEAAAAAVKEKAAAAAAAAEAASAGGSDEPVDVETDASPSNDVPAKPSHDCTSDVYTRFKWPPTFIGHTFHKSRKRGDPPGTLARVEKWRYKCKKCEKECTQDGNSNGALTSHMGECSHNDYMALCETPVHTKFQQKDGNVVKLYGFEEAFDKHEVRDNAAASQHVCTNNINVASQGWVVMMYLDFVPPSRRRRPGTRYYSTKLDAAYVPPHEEQALNILATIVELMEEELIVIFEQQRRAVGGEWLGEQTDMMSKHRKAFICLNGSMVLRVDQKLTLEPFLLAYAEFPKRKRHTGVNIADWWRGIHRKFGLTLSDIGQPTLDGGSNGQLACKNVFGKKGRTCISHDNARSVLNAISHAGTPRQNHAARTLVRMFRRYAAFARTSTILHDDVKDESVKLMGVSHELTLPNVTRWDGMHDMLEGCAYAKPAIRKVYSDAYGATGGVGETSAAEEEEEEEQADEASSDGEENDSGEELSEDGVDSDCSLSEGSDSENEGKKKKSKAPAKKKVSHETKVLKYTPTADSFDEAAQLQAALNFPRQLTKLTQAPKKPTLNAKYSLAATLVESSKGDLVVKKWQRTHAGESARYKRVDAVIDEDDIVECASECRRIYAEQMTTRVLEMDDERAMIAAMMDPSIGDPQLMFGDALYAKMKAAYSKCYHETEAELGLAPEAAPRAEKKQKTDAHSQDLFGAMIAHSRGSSSSSASAIADGENASGPRKMTEMETLQALREAPEQHAMYQTDGRMDMFKLADLTEKTRPVHYRMTQRIFADNLSEAVSESCFSTHACFATDLRSTTRPEVIAMMVFANRNHSLLFHRIRTKIWKRYKSKFYSGASSSGAAAASSSVAAASSSGN